MSELLKSEYRGSDPVDRTCRLVLKCLLAADENKGFVQFRPAAFIQPFVNDSSELEPGLDGSVLEEAIRRLVDNGDIEQTETKQEFRLTDQGVRVAEAIRKLIEEHKTSNDQQDSL